jgi:membrane protein DedA with SNARE-associated domain
MGAAFSWIVAVVATGGYGGILALMALESACIPLPSEVIMPFGGYLVSTGQLDLLAVATAGALGCNLGSTVAYVVGAYGGRPLVLRWGRYLLFGPQELESVDRFFVRHGEAAVFLGRLLPVVRTFISLPAGVARMPFFRFQIYTFLGSWPWCLALAYVGMRLGDQWHKNPSIQLFFHRFDLVVVGLLVLIFALYVIRRWRGRWV